MPRCGSRGRPVGAEGPSPGARCHTVCMEGCPLGTGTVPHLLQEPPHPVGSPHQHTECALALCSYEEQSFSLLLCPPVYPFPLCKKSQRRRLYQSLPTSFQGEPALLRQLPEGGLEAQKDEVTSSARTSCGGTNMSLAWRRGVSL